MTVFNEYYKLLRVSHWFKNVIVFFGWLIAVLFVPAENAQISLSLAVVAFFMASMVSSANYVINQITDIKHDKEHPNKRDRPLPAGNISIESAFLLGAGLFLTTFIISLYFFNDYFTLCIMALWIAGIIYNVRPVRAKDRPALDVLVESSNNPIRLLIGWFTVTQTVFPPLSLLFLTWSSAAILMTGKRYDELAHYGTKLHPYRTTFTYYSLNTLKLLLYLYSFLTLMFMITFALNYNNDYLYVVPLLALFLFWLVKLIVGGDAEARRVEDFVKRKDFMTYFMLLMGAILFVHFR